MVILDQFYGLKMEPGGDGGVRGEIYMLSANPEQPAVRLFDAPVLPDEAMLKEWSLRALQAYREG